MEKNINKDLISAYRFFRENDGYIVGLNAICALRSAKAERKLQEGLSSGNLKLEWLPDDEYNPHDFDEEVAKKEIELIESGNYVAEGVVLSRLCPTCGNWEVIDSLWGILHNSNPTDIRLYETQVAHSLID